VRAAHPGQRPHNKEKSLNTNRKLALRRQSISTLTTEELRIAHGGERTYASTGSGTCTTTGIPPTRQPSKK
jgi:hypothetical protein